MGWLVPLPVVLPLLIAVVLVAGTSMIRRAAADVLAITTALIVTGCCSSLLWHARSQLIVYWFGNWKPRASAAIGIGFAIDQFGAGMATLCAALVTAALVYSWRYFEAVRTLYHAVMLIFLGAMTGFCFSGDLFNLFVFFELMGVTAYALTAYKVEEEDALEGGLNFAVTNTIGGSMLLIAVALLYARTGALNLAQIGLTIATGATDRLVLIALTLIVCGFFIKAAVVPFHFWLSDAHAVAPTPVCVLLSGVMVELGLYGAFRVYWTVFHVCLLPNEGRVRLIFVILGVATALLGAVMCFLQRHLKRLLAFSTISHMGMMLVGMATLSAQGAAGCALYVIGHAFVKGGLFMAAGLTLHNWGCVDELELQGAGRGKPWLGIAFAMAAFGLAGFPPYGTWEGKALMEQAVRSAGYQWVRWVFLIASALTAGTVLRATARIFLGWGRSRVEEAKSPTQKRSRKETFGDSRRMPRVMFSMLAVFVLLPAVSGAALTLAKLVGVAGQRFVDTPAYSSRVMGATQTRICQTSLPILTEPDPSKALLMSVATLVVAVAVALSSLFCGAQCFVPRPVISLFRGLNNQLRRQHSGQIGDYVVWITLGTTVLAIALILEWNL